MSAFFRRGGSGIRALPVWCHSAPDKQAYVLFRKDFELNNKPQSVNVQVSAIDRYLLLLNGNPVARGPACGAGGVRFFDVHEELEKYLSTGRNTVAAIVYSNGPDERNRIMETEGCFILRLTAVFEAAPNADVSTDTSWKTTVCRAWNPSRTPINRWGVGYPEIFDPTKIPSGWDLPDFDASYWGKSSLKNLSGIEWRPRPVPPLRYEGILPRSVCDKMNAGGKIKGTVKKASRPKSTAGGIVLDASKPGSSPMVVLDFGRVIPARPRIKLKVPEDGGEMEVYYGESRRLEPIDLLKLRKGTYDWGTFLPRAFRYLGLSIRNAPKPVTVQEVEAEQESFPFREQSRFKSDNKVLTKVFSTAADTLVSSTRDYFMDCPGREQALWLGDVDRADAASLVLFGDERPGIHSMDLFTLMQAEDGTIPAVGPYSGDAFIPDFHLQWPQMLYRHYLYTGEEEFLEERFPSLSRSLAWVERTLDRRDLIPDADRPEWWCFLDWQRKLPTSGYSAALNILAFSAFRYGTLIAEALSRRDQAARWAKFAMSVDLAVKQAFYSRQNGLFSDSPSGSTRSFSQLANSLALCTELVKGAEARKLAERMSKAEGLIPVSSPYAAYWYADALFIGGQKQKGLEFLLSYWGAMVERGATTFWEMFDASSPENQTPFGGRDGPASLCHGWGAGVAELIVRHVLGLKPLEPGFRKILFRPAVDVVKKVSAGINLPGGTYGVSFDRPRTKGKVQLDLPEECEVEMVLEAHGLHKLTAGKRTLYVRGGPVVLPEDITKFSVQGDAVNLNITSGRIKYGYSISS